MDTHRYENGQYLLSVILGGFLAHTFQEISDIKLAIQRSDLLDEVDEAMEVTDEDIENTLTHLISRWTMLGRMQYRLKIKINQTDKDKNQIWFDLISMPRPEY